VEAVPAIARLRLDLRAELETQFSTEPVRAVHGALHQLLLARDAALARAVHAADVGPLTISPLYAAGSERPVRGRVRVGEAVWVRLGLLDGTVLATLFAALEAGRRQGRPLPLAGGPFAIEAVTAVAPPGTLRAALTYADLAASDAVADLVLRFTTPTLFRRKGMPVLSPEPRLVFGSYLRRWQAFSPVPLPGLDEAALREPVALVESDLREEMVDLATVRHPGFVGTVRYRIAGEAALQRGIAALAAYAAFCGTGSRTAFGMGQTERIA